MQGSQAFALLSMKLLRSEHAPTYATYALHIKYDQLVQLDLYVWVPPCGQSVSFIMANQFHCQTPFVGQLTQLTPLATLRFCLM